MSLYNIIDEISGKQVLKTETGDNRIFGVVVGIVANNYDKEMPGRVCVTVPVRDKDANELKWARVANTYSGTSWGSYFLPEVGDQVLIAFEEGNIEKPYVIGSVLKDTHTFLTKAVDENNQYKKIITKNGNSILFEDNKEGKGKKDKIIIETADSGHQLLMDNENSKLVLTNKEGNNKIEMATKSGEMSIKASSKLTIEVGETVKIVINGTSGEIKIEAGRVKAEATQSIEFTSNGTMKVTGSNTMIESSSMLKASASGMVQVTGSPIKIG